MKLLLLLILMLFVSCSHTHRTGHLHEPKMSNENHPGSELKVTHAGKDYFFTTVTERDAFLKTIEDEKKRSESIGRARGRR